MTLEEYEAHTAHIKKSICVRLFLSENVSGQATLVEMVKGLTKHEEILDGLKCGMQLRDEEKEKKRKN